jgi:hypothetical protein
MSPKLLGLRREKLSDADAEAAVDGDKLATSDGLAGDEHVHRAAHLTVESDDVARREGEDAAEGKLGRAHAKGDGQPGLEGDIGQGRIGGKVGWAGGVKVLGGDISRWHRGDPS